MTREEIKDAFVQIKSGLVADRLNETQQQTMVLTALALLEQLVLDINHIADRA